MKLQNVFIYNNKKTKQVVYNNYSKRKQHECNGHSDLSTTTLL